MHCDLDLPDHIWRQSALRCVWLLGVWKHNLYTHLTSVFITDTGHCSYSESEQVGAMKIPKAELVNFMKM